MHEVTAVMAGFGAGILPGLDAVLPPASLLVVEDPDVAAARDVRTRMRAFPCVAGLVEAPIQDEAGAEDVARALEPRLPGTVAAILPGLEYGVVGAAALAEARGLPGAGLAAARILRDKASLRQAADRGALAQPAWREVAAAQDVRDFVRGPYVLKPGNRQASIGVQLLDESDDIDAAWARTVGTVEPLMLAPGAAPPRYLVEFRLHGPEVSIEALVHQGDILFSNVTAKAVLPGRHPVELGHTVPAALDPDVTERLNAALAVLVAATGFASGTLHSEWILVDGVPHLVECAGRLPGDEIVPLIDLAYGGSLVADLLAVLSGRPPTRPPAAGRGAAVHFLTAPSGLIVRVSGTQAATQAEGVVDLKVTVQPGARVGELLSSWDRAGRVIATGPTGPEAAANAAAAASRIEIATSRAAIVDIGDPRGEADRWPARPDDPRTGLPWAAGAEESPRFLGLARDKPDDQAPVPAEDHGQGRYRYRDYEPRNDIPGPALWLRDSGGPATRMNIVDVVSGAMGDVPVDAEKLEAARAAYPKQLVSAATAYGSPLVVADRGCTTADLEALVAGFVGRARETGSTPAFLHVPEGDRLLDVLGSAGFRTGVTDLYPILDLPGTSPDDYLAALTKKQRGNVRTEIAARSAGSTETHIGEDARIHLAEASRLNATAYTQRRQHGDVERAQTIYSRLLDTCGDDFILTLVRHGDSGRPVASAVLIAGQRDLLVYSVGLELPDSRAVAGYFNATYYLPIEYAYEHGLTRILLGPTSRRTKQLRGARFIPLYSAVPADDALLGDLLTTADTALRSVHAALNS
ncbi:MAG TPA: ATP-grasp domain-containing protein [Actinocrinis sp.]|nr:ATP-grasp domain-containing protein [Actinocrinis sp.]